MGLRDDILNADDIDRRQVEIPEWGVTVELRTLSVARRNELLSECMNGTEVDLVRLYPALVVATAHDPATGEKLFSPSDADLLGAKSASAMERLARVAVDLAGLGDVAGQVEAGKGV